jgi:hypothetical protein|tara:strand:- start:73 stop:648 length:576 start_codon:yes stop_codon:yes gene_type:complete
LADADLDDSLIDLHLHDIIDMVRIFSVLAKPKPFELEFESTKHIPKLHQNIEPQFQDQYIHSEDQYIQLYQPELHGSGAEISNIQQLSKYVLELLREPILKKVNNHNEGDHICSLANLSDIMYSYSAIANITEQRQFIYDIENTAISKLILKDKFNTINSTKFLWGLAKFQNRLLNPYFNNDPASVILNRS